MNRKLTYLAGGAVALLLSGQAAAQGGQQYIGDVISVGFNFCPRSFHVADGTLLPVSQHTSLFSVIGCAYGGDCRTTFALPNLEGRVPLHYGHGPGLNLVTYASSSGAERQTMTVASLPSHTHSVGASTAAPMTTTPANHTFGSFSAGPNRYSSGTPNQPMQRSPQETVGASGGGQPFDIVAPYQTIRYCVAIEGLYPSRN